MKDREAKQKKEEKEKYEKVKRMQQEAAALAAVAAANGTNRSTISDEKRPTEGSPKNNHQPPANLNLLPSMDRHEKHSEAGSLKYVLWNTYNLIERKLLIIRMSEIALHTQNLLIKCFVCRQELAVVECLTCSEEFCKKCLVGVHNKVNVSSHKIVSLTTGKKKNAENTHDVKKSTLHHTEGDLKKSEITTPTTMWRKFENFAFPTQKMSDYQAGLKNPFETLKKIYINDNLILDDNTFLDLNIIKKDKSIKDRDAINIKKGDQSLSFQKFFELNDLNLEEKFMLNKIAFLNFKKRGALVKFHELYKQLKIFQEGSLESKLFLLFDILDEDEDGYISINDCLSFLQPRFFQNMRFENEIESVLNPLFHRTTRLEKKDFFKIFLDEPQAKEIMTVALQV